MSFAGDTREKIVKWMFERCDQYGIHEFHVNKAVSYMAKSISLLPVKNVIHHLKVLASICIGLSMKFYEKEPINFYQLQEIFDYVALMKEMNDLERNVLVANHFQLFNEKLNEDSEFKYATFKKLRKISESSEGCIYVSEDQNKKIIATKIYDAMPLECGISVGALGDLVFQRTFVMDNIMCSEGIMYENNKFSNGMQLCDSDLYDLLHKLNPLLHSNPDSYFEIIKSLLYNIAQAIKYIHDFGVVHCDLKPQNILVLSSKSNALNDRWKVKISDFGTSRSQFFNNVYSRFDTELRCYICTLWYRPIDILLGKTIFDNKTDIWSLGCIFAEAALGRPLFMADNETDMIKQIFSILDLPSSLDKTILLPYYFEPHKKYINQGLLSPTPVVNNYHFHKYPIPDKLKKLIQSMLEFDSDKRPNIDKILTDQYFSS